jgi:hypothetical protein
LDRLPPRADADVAGRARRPDPERTRTGEKLHGLGVQRVEQMVADEFEREGMIHDAARQ